MKTWEILFPASEEIDFVQTELPTLADDQILCRAEVSLVSIGTELRCLRGVADKGTVWSQWVRYPFRPGYSMTGTVLETGRAVKGFQAGDRIVTQNPHSQYFITREDDPNLLHIPSGVTFAEAAWQPLGCITQLGARRPDVRLGDDIAVVGLGLLGQLVMQYLRSMGARRLVAIDLCEERLRMAAQNGATHTFCGSADKAQESVFTTTEGRMLDIVYDVTGLPGTLSVITQLLKPGGSVVLLGDNTQPSRQCLGPNVVSDYLSIYGVHGSMCPQVGSVADRWTWRAMGQLFFDMLLDGRMRVQQMNEPMVSPSEARQIYRWLADEKPSALGILFDWTKA